MVSGASSRIYLCEIAFYCFWKCVLECFWLFRACLGAGSRRIGARPVDMGCAVRFGTDRVSGSTGLRGKSRL